jgi:hypothetical protein
MCCYSSHLSLNWPATDRNFQQGWYFRTYSCRSVKRKTSMQCHSTESAEFYLHTITSRSDILKYRHILKCAFVRASLPSDQLNSSFKTMINYPKAKAVPVHAMNELILDLGTRWGWVVSVTPRPLFSPGERTPGTHCTGSWVGLRAGPDTEARGETLSLLPGIELRSPGCPVHSRTLYWLSYPGPPINYTVTLKWVWIRILVSEGGTSRNAGRYKGSTGVPRVTATSPIQPLSIDTIPPRIRPTVPAVTTDVFNLKRRKRHFISRRQLVLWNSGRLVL